MGDFLSSVKVVKMVSVICAMDYKAFIHFILCGILSKKIADTCK